MSNKSELRELAKTVYESIKMVTKNHPSDSHYHSFYIINYYKYTGNFVHYTINEQKFNSLTEYYKLYVLKKNINCSFNFSINLIYENKDFLYNTFKQHPNILIELLEYIIIRNKFDLFEEIFTKHKRDIVFKKDVYKKLLDIYSRFKADRYHLHIYNIIITQYETEDMLYNNDDDDEIIEKEKELETKNYQILLLQKDKEIERLKIELEELRKFYIDS